MKTSKRLLTILLALVMIFSLGACANNGETGGDKGGKEIALRRAYFAAHGEKCTSRFAVAMDGETIVGALIEEFQFGDKTGPHTFVPNSDDEFGQGYAEGKALYSKVLNSDIYSKNMEEKAKATKKLDENYKAIQDFVIGKTVADLEKVIADAPDGKPVDAVSGSTLVDTKGYLQGFVEAAKNTEMEAKGTVSDLKNMKMTFIQGAPHGTKAFADTIVLVEGDKVVAANIDEFQFLAEGTGLPNSDKEFGQNYAEGKILASKKVNSEAYSKNMEEKAKATNTILNNYQAIEKYVAGKTIADLEKLVSEAPDGKPIDAVSGSTLVDTKGYIGQVVEAAKLAK